MTNGLTTAQLKVLCFKYLGLMMPVPIGGHLDRGVAKPRLYDFQRQFETAVGFGVYSTTSVEMPESMQAGVLSLAVAIDDAFGRQRQTFGAE